MTLCCMIFELILVIAIGIKNLNSSGSRYQGRPIISQITDIEITKLGLER